MGVALIGSAYLLRSHPKLSVFFCCSGLKIRELYKVCTNVVHKVKYVFKLNADLESHIVFHRLLSKVGNESPIDARPGFTGRPAYLKVLPERLNLSWLPLEFEPGPLWLRALYVLPSAPRKYNSFNM